MQGPPFALVEEEVQGLFESGWQMTLVEARDVLGENLKFLQRGLTRLDERAYRLIRTE
jgi:thiopurine S-methyltransferase